MMVFFTQVTQAFEKLKMAKCSTLVLATTDITKTIIVKCDASMHGTGAVLMQEGRALAFESQHWEECHHGGDGSTQKVCPFFSLTRPFKTSTIATSLTEIV
jgi:hypothetical protein